MAMQGKFGWILISNQEKKNALKIIPSHIRNAPNIGHPGGGGGRRGPGKIQLYMGTSWDI